MSTEPQGNGESESELRYDHKFDQGNEFTSTTSTWDKMTAAGKMGPVSVEDNGKRIPRVVTFIDTKEFTTDSCANFVGTGSKPVFSQKFSVLTAPIRSPKYRKLASILSAAATDPRIGSIVAT